jgi:hypothetical protein
MQPIHSLPPKSFGLLAVCFLMTACSTFTSSDDDDTSGIFKSLRSPPRIGELKTPKSPVAVPAISLKPTEPLAPGNAQSPKAVTTENNQAALANTAANSAPVAPPKPLSLQTDDSNVSTGPMLFAPPASLKKSLQCEGGATCLDSARDALVEDAKAKGWVMLLSRRVSLHNSFQFSRGERVIWIELNSNGKRDLDIEYTLLPIQSTTPRP